MKRIVSVTEQIVAELRAHNKGDTAMISRTGQNGGSEKTRVLIVEDCEADVVLMRRAVERCNCLVDVARDGIEAMDKINRHADPQFPDYQIVFLDIGLPRMDGVGVLRYIKTMAAPLHVVLVTGSATKAQLDEAAKLGYFGFIEKPLESKGVAEIFQKHKIPHFDPGI